MQESLPVATPQKNQQGRRCRTQTGQGLVEAAAALVILGFITAGAAVIIINSGVAVYYKMKIQSIALTAAQYASSLPSSDDDTIIEKKTKKVTDSLLSHVGLPASSKVKVDRSSDPTTVTVEMNNLPSLISLPFLPKKLRISDTELAVLSNRAPAYMLMEYQQANSAPAGVGDEDQFNHYLPILTDSQISSAGKQIWMLDSYKWPATHIIAHQIFDLSAPAPNNNVFPDYRGYCPGDGSSPPDVHTKAHNFLGTIAGYQRLGVLPVPFGPPPHPNSDPAPTPTPPLCKRLPVGAPAYPIYN